MLKNHSFWFKWAIALQCITGVVHSLSLLNDRQPANDSERKLFDLMSNYHFDFGAGFHRSMEDILNSFSIAFSLFLFFSGAINWFLLRNKLPVRTLRGLLWINLVFYAACWITMYSFTFLPPIICIGLILACLAMALVTIQKKKPQTGNATEGH